MSAGSKYKEGRGIIEIAGLVRKDIRTALKAGELPSGLGVSVTQRRKYMAAKLYIMVTEVPAGLSTYTAASSGGYIVPSTAMFEMRRILEKLSDIGNAYQVLEVGVMNFDLVVGVAGHVSGVKVQDSRCGCITNKKVNNAYFGSVLTCNEQIASLAEYILSNFPNELGRGQPNGLCSAPCKSGLVVEVAIRLLSHLKKVTDLKLDQVCKDPIEELAAYAHGALSGWVLYLLRRCKVADASIPGDLAIPDELMQLWIKRTEVAYMDLPEEAKESVRGEARKLIAIYRGEEVRV